MSFEQSSYSVDEGDTVDVTVTLSEDPERTVTIPLTTTDQDGVSSADYSCPPTSSLCRTEQTLTEDTIGRRREREAGLREHPADRGECWEHRRGCGHDHGRRRAECEVSFEQGTYTVDEGSTVPVTVTLNADPERTVIIPITTTDQDGASSADYSGVPASVTFNAGDTEVDINFTASSDSVDDDGESVKLTFGNTLPTGVSSRDHRRGCGEHHGRRRAVSEVSFEQSSYTWTRATRWM